MARRLTDRVHEGTEESKKRILDATMELAATRGYDGTTVALVSQQSGLPTGSVYWHFGNKDQLFVALLDRTFEQWMQRLQGRHADSRDAVRQKLADVLADAADEHDPSQGFWRLGLLLTLERRMSTTLARQRFLEIRVQVRQAMSDEWAQALPEDVVARDPELPSRIANLVMATGDGLYVSVSGGESREANEVVETLIAAVGALVEKQTDSAPVGRRRR